MLKLLNKKWSTKQVMKHLQKMWRSMNEAQTKRYKEMSEIDRNRFDRQRKLAKDGVRPGQTCSCNQKKSFSFINLFDT